METHLIVPQLAPLSVPMIQQLIHSFSHLHMSLRLSMEEQSAAFNQTWNPVIHQVQATRDKVYTLISQAIQHGNGLTTNWLREQVTMYTPQYSSQKLITAESISRWREQNLLLYSGTNRPEYNSAAAILTLRMLIQDKERKWLPRMSKTEPRWYCWRQDTPTSPVIPCPVPLPRDVPKHALLWTTWPGASWDGSWQSLGVGAARWAGMQATNAAKGEYIWTISEKELAMWAEDIIPLGNNILDTAMPQFRHLLANIALLRLASQRLSLSTV